MIKSLLDEQEETPKAEKSSKTASSGGSILSISASDEVDVKEAKETESKDSSESKEKDPGKNEVPPVENEEASDSKAPENKDLSTDTKSEQSSEKEPKEKKDTEKSKSSMKDLLSTSQIASNMGLALSMGVAVFGSVFFMLIIGWIADTLLGSSPYGMVVGIVIGSLMGIIQLFRISARIIMPKKSDFDKVSFRANEDEIDAKVKAASAVAEEAETKDPNGSESPSDAEVETVQSISAENILSETEAEIETLLAGASSDEANEIAQAIALIENEEGIVEEDPLKPEEASKLDSFVSETAVLAASSADTDDGEEETLVASTESDMAKVIEAVLADNESE